MASAAGARFRSKLPHCGAAGLPAPCRTVKAWSQGFSSSFPSFCTGNPQKNPLLLIHINYTVSFFKMQYIFYPFSIEFLSFSLFFCNVTKKFKITCIMSTRNAASFVLFPVGFSVRFRYAWRINLGFHPSVGRDAHSAPRIADAEPAVPAAGGCGHPPLRWESKTGTKSRRGEGTPPYRAGKARSDCQKSP